MDIGFEFDGCLQTGSGLGEALDAAGIDCRAPAGGAQGEGADANAPAMD